MGTKLTEENRLWEMEHRGRLAIGLLEKALEETRRVHLAVTDILREMYERDWAEREENGSHGATGGEGAG